MTQQINSAQHVFSIPRLATSALVAVLCALVFLGCAGVATSLWLAPVSGSSSILAVALSLLLFAGVAFLGLKLRPGTALMTGVIMAAFVLYSYAAGLSAGYIPISDIGFVFGASGLSMLSVGVTAVLVTLGATRASHSRSGDDLNASET